MPLSNRKKERILVSSPNWVGDAVMSLPALKTLHILYPDAEIIVLATPWVKEIYELSSLTNRIILYDRRGVHRGIAGLFRIVERIKDLSCSHAFIFPNSWRSAIIPWLARVPVRAGYAVRGRGHLFLTHPIKPPAGYRKHHQATHYLRIIQCLHPTFRKYKDKLKENEPLLSLPTRYLGKIDMLSNKFGLDRNVSWFAIAPGAQYGDAKCWWPENFAQVADRAAVKFNSQVLLFGSPSEISVSKQVANCMKTEPIFLAGETTLSEAIIVLSQCVMLLTNDSGLMHVGAALGVPLIAIFGSTTPEFTGPLGLQSLIRIYESPLKCHPCFKRSCPFKHKECMNTIKPNKVFEAVEELWELNKKRRI